MSDPRVLPAGFTTNPFYVFLPTFPLHIRRPLGEKSWRNGLTTKTRNILSTPTFYERPKRKISGLFSSAKNSCSRHLPTETVILTFYFQIRLFMPWKMISVGLNSRTNCPAQSDKVCAKLKSMWQSFIRTKKKIATFATKKSRGETRKRGEIASWR